MALAFSTSTPLPITTHLITQFSTLNTYNHININTKIKINNMSTLNKPKTKKKVKKSRFDFESEEEEEIAQEIAEVKIEIVNNDIVSRLPAELVTKILLFFHPNELFCFGRVCKKWQKISSDNFVWWRHCMKMFWEPDLRPKVMTKLDKKQKWKEHYVNVYLRNKTKIVEPPKEVVERWAEPAPPTKVELREHYKSIRSKPIGKKPVHVSREFFDC